MVLETKRLLLMPMTFKFVDGILNNDENAYSLFGIKHSEEWPTRDIFDVLPMIKEKLRIEQEPSGFDAWIFINKIDRSIVGDGGFIGAPNENGHIDIGYGIVESKRRNGYAYEAASALIDWGLSQRGVKGITADPLKDNLPSIKLLQKLGMKMLNTAGERTYFLLENPNMTT